MEGLSATSSNVSGYAVFLSFVKLEVGSEFSCKDDLVAMLMSSHPFSYPHFWLFNLIIASRVDEISAWGVKII
jgi:hypothetical protein